MPYIRHLINSIIVILCESYEVQIAMTDHLIAVSSE